jgi:hypothetical protein
MTPVPEPPGAGVIARAGMLWGMKWGRASESSSPERPYDPDRELVRSFAIGCGVLVLVFLCGWITIAYFWLR